MSRQSLTDAKNGRRRNRKVESTPESPLVRILRGAGLGILASSFLTLALLLGTAGFVYSRPDPDPLLVPTSLLVLAVSSLLCGMIAEHISGAEALPVGAVTGALWVLLSFLASLIVGDGAGALPSVYAMALRIPQLLLVLLGAFLVKRRPRRANPRRRR